VHYHMMTFPMTLTHC